MFWEKYAQELSNLETEEAEAARTENAKAPRQDWNFVLGGSAEGMSTEAMVAELEDFVAASTEVERRVAAMTASGTDSAGVVTVTVDAHGTVRDTEVSEWALDRCDAAQLARAFTAAAQNAVAGVTKKVNEAWDPILGGLEQLDDNLPIDTVSPLTAEFVQRNQQRAARQNPQDSNDSDSPRW